MNHRTPWHLILIAALLLWAAAGCNALARLGGAGAGAGVGAAVAGPLGAAGGAIAGDAVGNAFAPAEEKPQTVVNAAPGSTVYATPGDGPTPWYMRWQVLAAGAFLFYRRAPLFRALRSTTSPKALALNLWSALWASEKAAEKSKQATATHAAQRAGRRLRFTHTESP